MLGQWFEEKPKFLRKLNKISEEELHFILTCHKYRNELYHTGIKYDDIIFPLSWYYHELACELLCRLKLSYAYMWSSRDVISDAVKRHAGEKGIPMLNVEKALVEVRNEILQNTSIKATGINRGTISIQGDCAPGTWSLSLSVRPGFPSIFMKMSMTIKLKAGKRSLQCNRHPGKGFLEIHQCSSS